MLAFCRRKDGHGFHQAPSRSGLGENRRSLARLCARPAWSSYTGWLKLKEEHSTGGTTYSRRLYGGHLLASSTPLLCYYQLLLLLSKKGNSKPRFARLKSSFRGSEEAAAEPARLLLPWSLMMSNSNIYNTFRSFFHLDATLR